MFGSLFHSGRGSSGSAPPLHPVGCIRSSRDPEPAAAALVPHRLIDLWHFARNPRLDLPADPDGKLALGPGRSPHISGRVSAALLGRARLSGCISIVAGPLRRYRLSLESRRLRRAFPAPTPCRLVIGDELRPRITNRGRHRGTSWEPTWVRTTNHFRSAQEHLSRTYVGSSRVSPPDRAWQAAALRPKDTPTPLHHPWAVDSFLAKR